MELRQLEYFREVCRTGNFTRAAANLYVAQPAVTAAIHKLEDELEVQLFDRNNKRVTLTPEGRLFLERVQGLLAMANDITQEMRDFGTLEGGIIRLGVPPQIGAYLFPKIFLEFGTRFPRLQLNVSEEGSAGTVRLLEKGELDVGLVILPEDPGDLVTRPIRREPILLCLSPLNPLCRQAPVPFADLKDEKFILRKTDSFHREIVLRECRRCGFIPNVILSSSQIQTIKSLVSKNVGIAFFMEMVTRDSPEMVALPLAEPLHVTIGLAWKRGKYVSRATQAFIDFVIAAAGKPETL